LFEIAQPFLLALAIGLLVGIERERAHADLPTHDPLGSRTFTLLALLGAVAGYLEEVAIAMVIVLFAGAIVLAGYFRSRVGPEGTGIGVTTEVAAMATFVLGYMTHTAPVLAAMLGVIMIVLLALKSRIHEFAKAGIAEKEVSAALIFLVIALVVLPLLPDEAVDPWGLINPARFWLVLVLIAGISFGGYILVRTFGPGWGLPLAGFAAGLVSSTAATLSLAQRSRETKGVEAPAAAGIVLANTASVLAQLVIVAALSEVLLRDVAPVLGSVTLVGFVSSAIAVWIAHQDGESHLSFKIENPLALKATVSLALLVAVVMVVMTAASRVFGQAGTLVTSALGGSVDVHAVTFTVSNLSLAGKVPVHEATLAILVAFLANMVVKISLTAWAGSRRLLLVVAGPLLAMMAAGILAYLYWPG
jgi:uncharacterized membrane protein (DUF4010 family)